MSHVFWKDNALNRQIGTSILTKDKIIIDFLRENYVIISSFIKKTTLNIKFDNIDDLKSSYEYYQEYAKAYPSKDMQVSKTFNSLKLPLVALIGTYFQNKARTGVQYFEDLLTMGGNLDPSSDIVKYYNIVQEDYSGRETKCIYEVNTEKYEFNDEGIITSLKELQEDPEGFRLLKNILGDIRDYYEIREYTELEMKYLKQYDIDPKSIKFSKVTEYDFARVFLLFNLLFLDNKDRYVIFIPIEQIKFDGNFIDGSVLVDKKTLNDIINAGISGRVIGFNSLLETIEDTIADKREFDKFRSKFNEEYGKLAIQSPTKEQVENITKYMLEQIEEFPIINFEIETYNKQFVSIVNIVKSSDPKKRHEIDQKLGGAKHIKHNREDSTKTFYDRKHLHEL